VPVDPRDLRSLVAEIRGALDTHSKEEVAEILTYVFKEYVVEGPLPLAASAATVVAARSELEGLSFAQLLSWLQLHHDAPELALFDVQGERVSVRVGGRLMPLEAQAARPEPLPPPQPAPQPAAPAPTPTRVQARPAQPAAPAPAQPAAGAAQPAAPAPAQPAAGAAQPAAAQPAQPPAKTTEEGDSSRFSLLEVD
jgi:hypothetical protein